MKHLILISALLLAVACQPQDTTAKKEPAAVIDQTVVATINGEPVYENLVKFYSTARFRTEEVTEEQLKTVMDDLTQLYALAGEADKRGLGSEQDTLMKLELQRKNLMAQTLLQNYAENNEIDDAAVQAAYDSGTHGVEYNARHILVKEEELAADLIKQLDDGADFAELATEHSTGPTGAKGGDLGWFPASQMVKPFGDALATIDAGTYGKSPVQTQFGWHVIKVEETRKTPFEEVKAKLAEELKQTQMTEFIEGLKNSATVE